MPLQTEKPRTAGMPTPTMRRRLAVLPAPRTTPMTRAGPKSQIQSPTTRLPRLARRPISKGSERPLSDVRRLIKPLWPLDQRTTCDRPFAVFWDTSILERPSCSTRFDKPTSRKVKLVVLPSKLVRHTSPPTPLSRRLPLSTRITSSSSRSLVCLSSIPLVTSLSPISDLVARLFVTLLSWLSISCTVLSPRHLSPCACCETARLPSSSP